MTWPLSNSPTSRADFKEYCLRRLGKPVIEINVDDQQVEDRIDDALKYWSTYHCDATEKMYYKYQITGTDKTNGYITLPDNVIGAVRIFDLGIGQGSGDILNNVPFQIFMSEVYLYAGQELLPFYMTMMNLQFINDVLVGKQPIRYNRHSNRLYIDTNWNRWNVGDYIIVECYNVIDPDDFVQAWGDIFLQRYATALIKRQWGEQLKKFGQVQMAGGVVFNGQAIYDEAVAEIDKLEHEMISTWSLPVADQLG